MKKIHQLLLTGIALCLAAGTPARANLIITANYAGNIVSDPNASVIESAINTAISAYQSIITTNIDVFINFQEGGGLGASSTYLDTISYKSYYDALKANATSSNDAVALAQLSKVNGNADTNGGINPITGSTTINVKTANERALGLGSILGGSAGSPDGTITLNTSLTTPGSSVTTGQFSLVSVAEHEIDEVLGLGSALPRPPAPLTSGTVTMLNNAPFPEDLFRYTSVGVLATGSVNCASPGTAFFSLNGSTSLDAFNNACNTGDFADWAGGATPQVQDWQATINAAPVLGVELTALDAIGYTLSATGAPEPASWVLMFGGVLAGVSYKASRRGKKA